MIDAYAHVGLPRFQSLADYRTVMVDAEIGRAVLCGFDSSPDLSALHDAITAEPERFRAIGVPLGEGRAEIEMACVSQLAAGFSGLRLTVGDVVERPWLLGLLTGSVALVVGDVCSPDCAGALVAHLDRHADAVVVGGHFAGPAAPDVFEDAAVTALFAHPRFVVQFSRQGAWPRAVIEHWGRAVLQRTGWDRAMWGSEATVLFWRNESMADALAWVDCLAPSALERAAFFERTAERVYFSAPVVARELALPFPQFDRARPVPARLWANGLELDQALAGRLVHAWIAAGGRGTLGAYVNSLLDATVSSSPSTVGRRGPG